MFFAAAMGVFLLFVRFVLTALAPSLCVRMKPPSRNPLIKPLKSFRQDLCHTALSFLAIYIHYVLRKPPCLTQILFGNPFRFFIRDLRNSYTHNRAYQTASEKQTGFWPVRTPLARYTRVPERFQPPDCVPETTGTGHTPRKLPRFHEQSPASSHNTPCLRTRAPII